MFEIIILLLGLVIDTFIVTSVNGCTIKENIKTFLGIETIFSILGVLIGSFVLLYISAIDFRFICGILIILIQIIGIMGVNLPKKVDALLLGADSLVVFATLTWIYVPILFVFEACAITLGSYVGPKFMVHVPKIIQNYAGNLIMVFIAISLMTPFISSFL